MRLLDERLRAQDFNMMIILYTNITFLLRSSGHRRCSHTARKSYCSSAAGRALGRRRAWCAAARVRCSSSMRAISACIDSFMTCVAPPRRPVTTPHSGFKAQDSVIHRDERRRLSS
jgi:hypothetical protein